MLSALLSTVVVVDSLEAPGGFFNGVAYGEGEVFVADNRGPLYTYIYVVDPDDMTVVRSFRFPFANGGFNGLAYADGLVWAVHYSTGELWGVSPETGEVTERFSVPEGSPYPYGLCYDGAGFWFTDAESGRLLRLSRATLEPFGSYPLGFKPRDLGWFKDRLLIVSKPDTLVSFDPQGGITKERLRVPNVSGVAYGGGYLWLGANAGRGVLYKAKYVPPRPKRRRPRSCWGCLWWPAPPK